MNFNNQLLLGIVLIGLSILLATAALMIRSSRRREEPDRPAESQDRDSYPPLVEFDESPLDADLQIPDLEEDTLRDEVGTSPEVPPTPSPPAESRPETTLTPIQPEPDPKPPQPASTPPTQINVATLLRDEVSGELIIRIGDREYRNASDLKASPDWSRVEFASADLSRWFKKPPAVEPRVKREEEEIATAPKSMIEQINAILQQKIAQSPGDLKALRLIEAADGSARVLIGVQSYSLDEVPDPQARDLIRQAAAMWEDLQ